MLENGWTLELFSESNQQAIMSKFGVIALDDSTKLPVELEPKHGPPVVPKPKPNIPQPPMHKKSLTP